MDVNRIRLPGGVAAVLGVSARKARELSRTDPEFPAILVLGPRTRLVEEPDLLQYVAKKTSGRRIGQGVKA